MDKDYENFFERMTSFEDPFSEIMSEKDLDDAINQNEIK